MKEKNFWDYLGIGFVFITIAILLFLFFQGPEETDLMGWIIIYAIESVIFLAGLCLILEAGQRLGWGKPKTHLPDGNYRRLSLHTLGDNSLHFYLIKEGKKKAQPFAWKGDPNRILDEKDTLLSATGDYPERFRSQQGQIKALGQRHKKNPTMKKVYYFFPISIED